MGYSRGGSGDSFSSLHFLFEPRRLGRSCGFRGRLVMLCSPTCSEKGAGDFRCTSFVHLLYEMLAHNALTTLPVGAVPLAVFTFLTDAARSLAIHSEARIS